MSGDLALGGYGGLGGGTGMGVAGTWVGGAGGGNYIYTWPPYYPYPVYTYPPSFIYYPTVDTKPLENKIDDLTKEVAALKRALKAKKR